MRSGDAAVSLTATIAAQVAVAMAVMTVPVLAPHIAPDIGVEASGVGIYSGISFIGAILFTALAGSVTARHGAIRTTQFALLLSACGLGATMAGWLPPVLAGALAVGMGYGMATPAASHLLARSIPQHRRGLAFSVKQTGVPLGGFLLGVSVPVIAAIHGWVWGVGFVALILVAVTLAIQALRARYDQDRDPDAAIRPGDMVSAARLAVTDPCLSPLALAAFCYAMMQLSVFSFLVVVLVERGGLDPVTAGAVFSVMHAGGVVGRPVLGWLSDRVLPARPLLSLVGFGILACGIALALIDADWPPALLWAVSAATGVIAAGWNGVYIGEIARIMPGEMVGRATGGVSAFAFLGVAIGPAVFSAIVAATDGYGAAFIAMGVVALVPAVLLLRAPRPAE